MNPLEFTRYIRRRFVFPSTIWLLAKLLRFRFARGLSEGRYIEGPTDEREERSVNRHSVGSSNIDSLGYDPETLTLELEFHGGRIYQYDNVPVEIYREFLEAGSKGSYFHTHIKNQYHFNRVR